MEKWVRTSQNLDLQPHHLTRMCVCVLQWFYVVLLWLQLAVCCSATVTNVETHNSVTLSPVSADCFTAVTTCREQSVSTFCCRLKICVYNEWVMNSRGEVTPSTFKQEKMWAPCPAALGCSSAGLYTETALWVALQRQQSSTPTSQSNGNERLTAANECSWTQCPSMHRSHINKSIVSAELYA